MACTYLCEWILRVLYVTFYWVYSFIMNVIHVSDSLQTNLLKIKKLQYVIFMKRVSLCPGFPARQAYTFITMCSKLGYHRDQCLDLYSSLSTLHFFFKPHALLAMLCSWHSAVHIISSSCVRASLTYKCYHLSYNYDRFFFLSAMISLTKSPSVSFRGHIVIASWCVSWPGMLLSTTLW